MPAHAPCLFVFVVVLVFLAFNGSLLFFLLIWERSPNERMWVSAFVTGIPAPPTPECHLSLNFVVSSFRSVT